MKRRLAGAVVTLCAKSTYRLMWSQSRNNPRIPTILLAGLCTPFMRSGGIHWALPRKTPRHATTCHGRTAAARPTAILAARLGSSRCIHRKTRGHVHGKKHGRYSGNTRDKSCHNPAASTATKYNQPDPLQNPRQALL